MRALLNFFLKLEKLKTNRRKGWSLYKIKDPSSTADHIFRAAILAWILNKQKGLDEGRVIKTLLVHHLPDISLGEQSPYEKLLPKHLVPEKRGSSIFQLALGAQNRQEIQRRGQEQRAMKRVVSRLPKEFKEEIVSLWQGYSNQKSKIAKFTWQIGKTESYLQALEYWKSEDKIEQKFWTRWAKKYLRDPLIIKFRREIDHLFLSRKRKCDERRMCDILDFIIETGELKRLKRRGWVLSAVKRPESVAQHTFQMTMIAWAIGQLKGLDTDRVVKIALAHDLCEVYAGDQTPYDPILTDSAKTNKKLASKPPRLPYLQKMEWLIKKKDEEWKALVKLTSRLAKGWQEELVGLWVDFEEGLTKEGRFVYQVDKLVNLIQAIEYWKKDKNFPINRWWVDIKERIDDSDLLKLVKELDKYYSTLEKNKR